MSLHWDHSKTGRDDIELAILIALVKWRLHAECSALAKRKEIKLNKNVSQAKQGARGKSTDLEVDVVVRHALAGRVVVLHVLVVCVGGLLNNSGDGGATA